MPNINVDEIRLPKSSSSSGHKPFPQSAGRWNPSCFGFDTCRKERTFLLSRRHLRSKGPVINELAAKHDGGGHALASGANAKDLDEVKQIFAEVVEVTKKYKEDHE